MRPGEMELQSSSILILKMGSYLIFFPYVSHRNLRNFKPFSGFCTAAAFGDEASIRRCDHQCMRNYKHLRSDHIEFGEIKADSEIMAIRKIPKISGSDSELVSQPPDFPFRMTFSQKIHAPFRQLKLNSLRNILCTFFIAWRLNSDNVYYT